MTVDARKILDDHPLFAKAITEFMTLLDAAEVLDELKPAELPQSTSFYLRAFAVRHIRSTTTLPDDFIRAMIDARPPVTARPQPEGEPDGT